MCVCGLGVEFPWFLFSGEESSSFRVVSQQEHNTGIGHLYWQNGSERSGVCNNLSMHSDSNFLRTS